MQAIITKYLGPTNTKPSRIKATAEAGSVTIPVSCDLDDYEQHGAAVEALCRKFRWIGQYYGGGTSTGYAWVTIPSRMVGGLLSGVNARGSK